MIADVAFDAPVDHPFSYRIPSGWTLSAGQRVLAPLGGARRVGMVVAVREGDDAALKPLLAPAEPSPALDAGGLDLVRWIAAEALSSVGSTSAALLPPVLDPTPARGRTGARRGRDGVAAARRADEPPTEVAQRADSAGPISGPARAAAAAGPANGVELLIGAGRERRLLDRIAQAPSALVIVPDVEAAARWAQRLARGREVLRLDSGMDDTERARAWPRLGGGGVAVGTRSALLAPLPAGAVLALVDEHEAAHKPPGPPRIHSRDVVLERAQRERRRALLTAATPSVELWWRATDRGGIGMTPPAPGPWPAVTMADTRGILRREPLTPPLARAVRETLAAGRRVLLLVSRLASSLACDECGEIVRCPQCALALVYTRAAATLSCRLCGTTLPLPDTCGHCRGRRLSPFGWGLERVEHAVRRRFPKARVARWDPEASRGAKGEAQRAAAAAAEVVIGTRGALRLFGPASLGLAGFVSPDQLLRLPDFRAGERMFALMWAAAERVGAAGGLVIQSLNPGHYALDAVARQELAAFYRAELKFRAELGYPPFRRLALITVTGGERRLADEVAAALRASSRLTVYPPVAERRERARRIVVKGHADLPAALSAALEDFRGPRPRSRGIIDVEVDPVEWPS
ncbi:MAG TPA: primosomal protein N' [Methylomirabilota bacterium]